MKIRSARFLFVFLALLCSGATSALFAQREHFSLEELAIIDQKWPGTKRTYTGLRYLVLKPGDQKGRTPQPGMVVTALYKGMLLDGTVFDQAQDPKNAFHARIGRSELIRGWDEALMKMHKGEKWLLIVPYDMAYGVLGRPPAIPREATLVFEMEMVDFARN